MRKAQYFEFFVKKCKHFDSSSDVNNGYGCKHPAQEETEDGHGKCYCWSCPLGCPADKESLDEKDIQWVDGKPDTDDLEEESYIILNDEFPFRKYYEIEFDNDKRSRDTDGDLVGEYSICIIAEHEPTYTEAENFCRADMEKAGYKYVVSIHEIDLIEAHHFYDMENEDKYPVLQ